MAHPVTEHVLTTTRHETFYLACGDEDAPLVIFLHGWPELSRSWRHQLPAIAALGYRCIAPDMRGYGRSSTYARHEDYAGEHIVADMIELLESLGAGQAIWVGHDLGAVIVWALAQHHPDRCVAIANLCVPYIPEGFAIEHLLPYADRTLYPEDRFPAAQWDYHLFYRENFANACAAFEANPRATVKAMFRSGNPAGRGRPSFTAGVRARGGWYGPNAAPAPNLPRDGRLMTQADEDAYTAALEHSGFVGPDSWYMNADANTAFARRAEVNWRITLPVLFLHAAHDYVCETITSRLAEPMRAWCPDLTETTVSSGHWMAQECPAEVNAALTAWLESH